MNWSSDDNIKITYRLLNVRGYGSAQTNKLLCKLKLSVNSSCQLEESIIRALKPQEVNIFTQQYVLYQRAEHVGYVSMLDDHVYPNELRQMLAQNTPTVLSYMGNLDLLKKKKVGLSGSRKVSEKGMWITEDCVRQLAEDDICIVSGYANGVDMIAHQTALKHGASTIIVLPEGISHFYIRPALRDIWDWNRVLVISEFMPYDKWMASKAMKRNLTIIGLSDAMLVIEAGETGGSLNAGINTMEAGKPLFVPQYNEVPTSALGNNILLSKGASALRLRRDTRRTNMENIRLAMDKNKIRANFFV